MVTGAQLFYRQLRTPISGSSPVLTNRGREIIPPLHWRKGEARSADEGLSSIYLIRTSRLRSG